MNRNFTCATVLAIAAATALPYSAEASAAPSPPQHSGSIQAQSYLGVDLRDISQDEVAPLKLKDTHGAEIVLVDHDAPAGKAGLREHDVVLQINGHPVSSQDQMRHMLNDCPAGHTLALLISRDGQQMTITATTSTREEVEHQAWAQHISVGEPQDSVSAGESSTIAPSAGTASASPAAHGNSFIGSLLMNSTYTGAMLEQMSSQLAAYFGATTGGGLLVRSVVENSPAALAGMRAGDVIVSANERQIATTSDWAKIIKNGHGHPISVTVLRDKQEHSLTLTPDPKHRSSLDDFFVAPERTLMAYLNRSWLP